MIFRIRFPDCSGLHLFLKLPGIVSEGIFPNERLSEIKTILIICEIVHLFVLCFFVFLFGDLFILLLF